MTDLALMGKFRMDTIVCKVTENVLLIFLAVSVWALWTP